MDVQVVVRLVGGRTVFDDVGGKVGGAVVAGVVGGFVGGTVVSSGGAVVAGLGLVVGGLVAAGRAVGAGDMSSSRVVDVSSVDVVLDAGVVVVGIVRMLVTVRTTDDVDDSTCGVSGDDGNPATAMPSTAPQNTITPMRTH